MSSADKDMDTRLRVSRADRACWDILNKFDQHTLDLVKFFKPHGDKLFAVLNDGRFIAAGNNSKGLLGLGHRREVKTFEEIRTLKDKKIKDVVCGEVHVMVLTEEGQVWGWGRNFWGNVCGDNDFEDVIVPKQILDGDIVDVKCGNTHALALKTDGKVMAWGDNEGTQIGISNFYYLQPKPLVLKCLENEVIQQIEAGTDHSVAVSKDGKVFGWGSNQCYQLGVPNTNFVREPVRIDVHSAAIKSVACSWTYTLFLTQNGLLYINDITLRILRRVLVGTESWRDPLVSVEHIACVNYSMFDVCASKLFIACTCDKLYFWGDTKDGLTSKPTLTDLSLSQTIAQHSRFQAFPSVLYMQPKEKTENRNNKNATQTVQPTQPNQCGQQEDDKQGKKKKTRKKKKKTNQTPGSIQPNPCGQQGDDKQEKKKTTLADTNLQDQRGQQEGAQKVKTKNTTQTVQPTQPNPSGQQEGGKQGKKKKTKKKKTKQTPSSTQPNACGQQDVSGRNDKHQEKEHTTPTHDQILQKQFCGKVSCLLDSPEFSDIEFVFPDHRSIKAHRVILFASSDYMSAQLRTAWKYLSSVSITSHPYPVFHRYLSYLYTRTLSLDDIDQLASLVRLALDFHELHLQQVCVDLLFAQLNIETCSRVYELAIELKMEQLEKQASEMIIGKIAQVKLTEGFKNMNAERAKNLLFKL